ncbi:hypothetical protein [Teredinibacter waterburyi]|uniref:hypothetical protein n=1 Tax=Teredinibacter waterburyi TaxID=1500538 RepID=UPI00165F06D4|nr:hypothetical protein [Teredinibacter waterburyi]
MATQSDNSIEVELIAKVKSCTDCSWFWGAVPPYGPYPSFDWVEKYPKAIKDGPSAAVEGSNAPVLWTDVSQNPDKRVEPAVLRGCRKAPIMTIGINPNMTAFFASAKSTTWAYPHFSDPATYAYYYRHATIYQESFDLNVMEQQIIPGSEIRAEFDCSVEIARSDTHRWLSLIFRDLNTGELLGQEEYAWMPEERLMIFANKDDNFLGLVAPSDDLTTGEIPAVTKLTPSEAGEVQTAEFYAAELNTPELIATSQITETSQSVENLARPVPYYSLNKGDLIAAKVKSEPGKSLSVYANPTGYYERLQPVLHNLNSYFASQGFSDCKLTMGEDVSMHDMVGCASPGWGARYNIPTEWISHKCVNSNRYMLDQLIQSQPRVVLIVSTSSLTMFSEGFKSIGGEIDISPEQGDVFELLKETSNNRHTISWPKGDGSGERVESRIIVTPHFSYGDNFDTQSQIPKAVWADFAQQFKVDIETLQQNKVEIKPGRSTTCVFFSAENTELQAQLSPEFWHGLMTYYINPYQLIEQALVDEHQRSPLISNPSAPHLDRAQGDCSFCLNSQWQFPEGCDYGIAEPIS